MVPTGDISDNKVWEEEGDGAPSQGPAGESSDKGGMELLAGACRKKPSRQSKITLKIEYSRKLRNNLS